MYLPEDAVFTVDGQNISHKAGIFNIDQGRRIQLEGFSPCHRKREVAVHLKDQLALHPRVATFSEMSNVTFLGTFEGVGQTLKGAVEGAGAMIKDGYVFMKGEFKDGADYAFYHILAFILAGGVVAGIFLIIYLKCVRDINTPHVVQYRDKYAESVLDMSYSSLSHNDL